MCSRHRGLLENEYNKGSWKIDICSTIKLRSNTTMGRFEVCGTFAPSQDECTMILRHLTVQISLTLLLETDTYQLSNLDSRANLFLAFSKI